MDDYANFDATGLAELVAQKAVTPDELLDAALNRAATLNPDLNAVVLTQEATARHLIKDTLPDGPFKGVPFLLKDLGCEARDFPSHNGSRLFANTTYSYDSEIYTRIKATGVVTFARTTSPEGGVGPATESAVYGGPTRNPWDLSRTSGGSSGGAGAAVAAGIVPMAHGSDGGGSVRIPAASCGLFGLKPTRARLPDGPASGEGWAGMAIDGFLTRTVRDTARMLDACAGADTGAPYWAPPLGKGFAEAISRPPRSLRIALCDTTLTGTAIDPEVADAVRNAAHLLASLGHKIEIARPSADTQGMMRAWTKIVACGSALSIRNGLKGRPLSPDLVEGVGRGAVAYAAGLSGADYLEAVEKIHSYGREMARFFDGYDMLLTATLATPATEVGRYAHDTEDYEGFRIGAGGVFDYSPFCAAFNASGQPAASVPLYQSTDNLPIGVHLAAHFAEDELLIALCAQLEHALPWITRKPPRFGETLAKQA